MNTQNASDDLRTLEAAEVDAVSGAAIFDLGLFGTLLFSPKGCAIWTGSGPDENGQEISFTQCPK